MLEQHGETQEDFERFREEFASDKVVDDSEVLASEELLQKAYVLQLETMAKVKELDLEKHAGEILTDLILAANYG